MMTWTIPVGCTASLQAAIRRHDQVFARVWRTVTQIGSPGGAESVEDDR
jgi:hypothetical protein